MDNYKQITLFKVETEQPQEATKPPQTTIITGLIKRQLAELETCTSANWIASNAKLKFKREGSTNGNI